MADQIPFAPWHEFQDAWDKLVLNGKEWPGIAMVEIDRANKWDTKKAQGSHGAEREFKGADLASVRITIKLWTSDHFDVMNGSGLLADIEPDPGKKKQDAVPIQHAVAALRKVTSITVDSVSGPRLEGGIGIISIAATEYRAPSSDNATGTANGRGGTGGNKANQAAQASSDCASLKAYLAGLQADYAEAVGDYNYKQQLYQEGRLTNPDGFFGGVSEEDVAEAEARMNGIAAQIADLQAQQERLGCNNRGPDAGELDP